MGEKIYNISKGSKIKLTANLEPNYTLDHWVIGDREEQSNANPLILDSIKDNTLISAVFSYNKAPDPVDIIATVEPDGYGLCNGVEVWESKVIPGTKVTIECNLKTVIDGLIINDKSKTYKFIEWSDKTTDNPKTFTVGKQGIKLIASLRIDPKVIAEEIIPANIYNNRHNISAFFEIENYRYNSIYTKEETIRCMSRLLGLQTNKVRLEELYPGQGSLYAEYGIKYCEDMRRFLSSTGSLQELVWSENPHAHYNLIVTEASEEWSRAIKDAKDYLDNCLDPKTYKSSSIDGIIGFQSLIQDKKTPWKEKCSQLIKFGLPDKYIDILMKYNNVDEFYDVFDGPIIFNNYDSFKSDLYAICMRVYDVKSMDGGEKLTILGNALVPNM